MDLTQKQMAEKLGITTATYQKYEAYTAKIPAAVLVSVADMAGIVDVREIKYRQD